MPQASDELRDKMNLYFGDRIDEFPPRAFLIDCGWEEAKGILTPPDRQITKKEWDCAQFLCDEWDYAVEGKNK